MLGQMPAGVEGIFRAQESGGCGQGWCSSKTAIENLNSENMELKSKVGTSIILSR